MAKGNNPSMSRETSEQAIRGYRDENMRQDSAALQKSRLHKVRLDLLARLEAAPAERKPEILARIKDVERRRKELEGA